MCLKKTAQSMNVQLGIDKIKLKRQGNDGVKYAIREMFSGDLCADLFTNTMNARKRGVEGT